MQVMILSKLYIVLCNFKKAKESKFEPRNGSLDCVLAFLFSDLVPEHVCTRIFGGIPAAVTDTMCSVCKQGEIMS